MKDKLYELKECGKDDVQQEDMEIISQSTIDFEEYRNSVVFITGATGLVGSTLVRSLLCCNREKNLGLHVVAAVRNPEKARKVYGELLEREDLEIYVGDITRKIEFFKSVDYIFHTASVTASKTMVEHPVCTIETAYQGTKNVLEFAKRNPVKGVVYISSMEVYGRPDEKLEMVTEKDLGYIDIGNVRSSYSEGKRICECLCVSFSAEYGVPVRIARLAQTFGAGVLESDNRVYVQFAKSAIMKNDIVLHTDGTSEGNYCYLRDAIKALLILGYNGINGEAYNVVNESTHMQIREMANMVAKELCNGQIKVKYDIPESSLTYGYAPAVKMKLSSAKMRELGWNPEVGLLEAYQRLVRSIQCR